MSSRRRLATSIILILVGLALTGFFGLVLAITDCGERCQANGERAPAIVFIGTGIGLVVMGASMLAQGPLRGVGWGALTAGVIILSGSLWVLVEGARGMQVYVPLAVGVGDALVGAWLAFWRPR